LVDAQVRAGFVWFSRIAPQGDWNEPMTLREMMSDWNCSTWRNITSAIFVHVVASDE
jgi:hypothetical protein